MTSDGFDPTPGSMLIEGVRLLVLVGVLVGVPIGLGNRVPVVLLGAFTAATLGWILGFSRGLRNDG